MRTTTLSRICAVVGTSVLALVTTGIAVPGTATAAASHALIQGTGSSWSANAVNQWISDVTSTGLQVVFTGSGSANGRKDFANGITDFAVSDIGYQGLDPQGGVDSNCIPGQKCRTFAYEPIVAGGTSFPYQVKVAGKLVDNLRLSGLTLAKIFTYQITNWNDGAITTDNNGRRLPSLPIVVVSHSEGSGSSAQFTTYLATQYPTIWQAFSGSNKFLEQYPAPKNGQNGIQQNGSDGVMNFVSSAAANGAIGYDEFSYPLAKNYPVAKLLNRAGYYTLPTQYNVAVALQHAVINQDKSSPDYLLQKLDQVYVAPEAQAYAMSSYSYFLIPTASDDARMTTAKRQTLSDYLYYSVCQGQKEMGPIGYSPLPINLVQASFAQTAKLKGADPGVDLTQRDVTTCQNPTFVAGHPEINHLAQIAPAPPACDKQGQGPANADGSCPTGASGGSGVAGGGGSGSGSPGTGAVGSTNGKTTGGAKLGTGTVTGTGSATGFGDAGGGSAGSGSGNAQPAPVNLAALQQQSLTKVLAPLAVVELLAVLILPPVVYFYVLRRRRRQT